MVISFQITPDGSVRNVLLVARGHFFNSTVRRNLGGGDIGRRTLAYSSSRSVEASFLSGNSEINSIGGGSETQTTSTHVELKEISLFISIEGDTVELSTFSKNVFRSPSLLLLAHTSEKISLS